jgi:hypothetical protein
VLSVVIAVHALSLPASATAANHGEPVRTSSAAAAPGALRDTVPEHEPRLIQPRYAIVAVRVTQAAPSAGTHGDPPGGQLQVLATLRGPIREGAYQYRRYAAAEAADVDEVGKPTSRWYARPLAALATGDQAIVFVRQMDGPQRKWNLLFIDGPMVRDTPANRATVRQRMRRDLSAYLTLLLPAVLLLITAAGMWRLRRRWARARAARGL